MQCLFLLDRGRDLNIHRHVRVISEPKENLGLGQFDLSVYNVRELYNTYSGEGVVQIVNGPSNDDNVVNVKPEGQDSCCKANT